MCIMNTRNNNDMWLYEVYDILFKYTKAEWISCLLHSNIVERKNELSHINWWDIITSYRIVNLFQIK